MGIKKLAWLPVAAAAGLMIVGCDRPNLKETKGQYSYALGYQIANNMKRQGVAIDAASFGAAVKDVMAGKDSRLTEDQMRDAMKKMAEGREAETKKVAASNLEAANKFLEQNKTKDGVKTTESGLQYKVIEEGKGKKPKEGDVVEVHYRGKLLDGKEFDSSYSRNAPAQFPVKAVIPGWTEALQLMTVGSKYELYIPPKLAYGEQGNQVIPPNSALIFEVELLKIVK